MVPDRTGATYTDDENYIYPPITGATTDASFENTHAAPTEQLISIVEHDPELKAMLEKSIAMCAEINPDRTTNPAQTLDEYYDYLDWAATALPWQIAPWTDQYSTLYDRIDQSLNYFYWLVDQPLEELEGRGYYNNTLEYHEPFRSWMILFTETYGQFLSTTDSWNDEYYQIALSNPDFQLDGDLYEDSSNWKTFNQFFARYLSDPSKRPIAEPDNPSVVVSPADTQPQGVWEIDDEGMVVSDDPITIKSGTLRSVDTLLGPSEYAGQVARLRTCSLTSTTTTAITSRCRAPFARCLLSPVTTPSAAASSTMPSRRCTSSKPTTPRGRASRPVAS